MYLKKSNFTQKDKITQYQMAQKSSIYNGHVYSLNNSVQPLSLLKHKLKPFESYTRILYFKKLSKSKATLDRIIILYSLFVYSMKEE